MVDAKARNRASSKTPTADYGPEQVHQIEIGKIKPYPNNPRVNDRAIDAVAASIQDFGFRVPLLLTADYVIIAGHTRWEASKRLGRETVPCMFGTDMTPEQIQAYRLVDNKTAELADWDRDKYSEEIAALQEVGIDLTSYGWEEKDLEDIRSLTQRAENAPAENAMAADPDRPRRTRTVAAVPSETRIQIGSFSFLVPKATFDAWMSTVEEANSANRDRMVADFMGRLGIQLSDPSRRPRVSMRGFGQRTRSA